jgi:methylated-DNA-[protein]-cysteine S-methyltransferase
MIWLKATFKTALIKKVGGYTELMKTAQWLMNSKIGPVYLVASEKGLQGVFLKKQKTPLLKSLKGADAEVKILSRTVHELKEYLDGKRKKFDLPLHVTGTPFQKRVWGALSKIPYGETYSYKDIAHKIKNPKAVRAVGTANGKNPLCVIVPCHRVIAAYGSLGGYSGGLDIKRKLLNLEQKPKFIAAKRQSF